MLEFLFSSGYMSIVMDGLISPFGLCEDLPSSMRILPSKQFYFSCDNMAFLPFFLDSWRGELLSPFSLHIGFLNSLIFLLFDNRGGNNLSLSSINMNIGNAIPCASPTQLLWLAFLMWRHFYLQIKHSTSNLISSSFHLFFF